MKLYSHHNAANNRYTMMMMMMMTMMIMAELENASLCRTLDMSTLEVSSFHAVVLYKSTFTLLTLLFTVNFFLKSLSIKWTDVIYCILFQSQTSHVMFSRLDTIIVDNKHRALIVQAESLSCCLRYSWLMAIRTIPLWKNWSTPTTGICCLWWILTATATRGQRYM